jgi:hypothetical protein
LFEFERGLEARAYELREKTPKTYEYVLYAPRDSNGQSPF